MVVCETFCQCHSTCLELHFMAYMPFRISTWGGSLWPGQSSFWREMCYFIALMVLYKRGVEMSISMEGSEKQGRPHLMCTVLRTLKSHLYSAILSVHGRPALLAQRPQCRHLRMKAFDYLIPHCHDKQRLLAILCLHLHSWHLQDTIIHRLTVCLDLYSFLYNGAVED